MAFVEPVTLRSGGIALVPLSLAHEDGLRAAAADGELWRLRVTSVPEPRETRAYVETALAMREALQEPFVVDDALMAVDASIGIALSPAHAQDGDRLLQLADVAMYAAKRSGGGSAVYDVGNDTHTADRLVLLAELRGAISRDEIVVEYQPQVDLRTGRPVGLEALARWQHPTRGLLGPDAFIPLAERSGMIGALSAHVLVQPGADCHRIRLDLERLLHETFGIDHTTLQVEHVGSARGLEISRSSRAQ